MGRLHIATTTQGTEPERRTETKAANVDRCIPIQTHADILDARARGRELASELGFSSTDCTLVATAISELAGNIVLYAGQGEIRLNSASRADHLGVDQLGVVITACDRGPGIPDTRNALLPGFSTSQGLGLGLPGVKRIMDEFQIVSEVGVGTTVFTKKWKPR